MNTTINFRTTKKLKHETDKIFEDLGISRSVALNMYLNQVRREKAIPFNLSVNIRRRWDREVKDAKKTKGYTSAKVAFSKNK
jgi:addiction module RelB/DinJ family antitoxin